MKKNSTLLSKILEGIQRKQSSKGSEWEIAKMLQKQQNAAADMLNTVAEQGEKVANLKLDLAIAEEELAKVKSENLQLKDEVTASKLKLKETSSILEMLIYGIIFVKNFVDGYTTGYSGLCATAGLYGIIALISYIVDKRSGGLELYRECGQRIIRYSRYIALIWNICFTVLWVVYLSGTAVPVFPILAVVNAAMNTMKSIVHFIFSDAEISYLEKKHNDK